MANIQQRGNSFRISVFVGEDQSGKKLYEKVTYRPKETAPTKIKKEVEAFAHDFEERVKNGKYIEGDKLTFIDVIKLWKEDQSYKDLTLRIKEEYENTLNRRAIPAIGNIVVTKISPVHLQSIYNGMEKEGKAPGTIKKVNTAINSVLRYAYRMELIENNPCDRVRLPKIKKDNTLHYFDIEQSKIFINALSSTYTVIHKGHKRKLKQTGEEYTVPDYTSTVTIPYQFQVYFTIAVYSGFRRGEMVALTWEDINFETQSIDINKAMAKTKSEGTVLKDTKTVSGNREIKLPKVCFDMLREWKVQQRELSLQVGTQWQGYRGKEFDKNNVFIQTENDIGLAMHIDTPTAKFRDIINLYNSSVDDPEKKLPMIRLHDLRHTSATLLLSQGADIETVSHRLGHSNPSVTLDIYGHALECMDEKASDILENLLSEKAN